VAATFSYGYDKKVVGVFVRFRAPLQQMCMLPLVG
jgi:hypothetical protein